MKQALADVVLALKDKPQAVVSLVAVEEEAPPGQDGTSGLREKAVQEKLADKWGATIGDELVAFAALADPDNPDRMDKTAKGMIDLRWKFTPQGDIQYTIEFRKSPDEAPIFSRIATVPAGPSPDQTAQAMADKLLEQTVLPSECGTPRRHRRTSDRIGRPMDGKPARSADGRNSCRPSASPSSFWQSSSHLCKCLSGKISGKIVTATLPTSARQGGETGPEFFSLSGRI